MAKKTLLGNSKVKSMVIITAENSNSQQASSADNKRWNKELRKWFSESKYLYCPAKGKFDNTENSYVVFNVSLDVAKRMASKFRQTSFIFVTPDGKGGFVAEYYEVSDLSKSAGKGNAYKLVNSSKVIEEVKGNSNYTLIGKDFKFKFPDEMFSALDEISDNCNSVLYNGVGAGAYAVRVRVYAKALKIMDEYKDTQDTLGPWTEEEAENILTQIKDIEGVVSMSYNILTYLSYPDVARIWVALNKLEEVMEEINKIPGLYAEAVLGHYRRKYIKPYGECVVVKVYGDE